MTKTKKISIFIFSLMLVLASFLFVACGKNNYSKTYLSASSTFVEVYKGEENAQSLSVTINNPVGNMSNKIMVVNSNPHACSVEELVVVDYTTTFTIAGLNGGESTLSFKTQEGNRELEVSVIVREYADNLAAGENSLYVSSSTAFIPSSADFDFGNETITERNLEYYFYGKVSKLGEFSENVLEDNIVKNNEFIRAELVNVENKYYIIFTNSQNKYYTLSSSSIAEATNLKYGFVEVTKNENVFVFDTSKTLEVSAGEKFAFIAKYEGESAENIIFCEREFYVLSDINQENFAHEFGYKISGVDYVPGDALTSYKTDAIKNGGITLIPGYTKIIDDQAMLYGRTSVFATAYLEVQANASNDLLKVKWNSEKENAINCIKLKETENGNVKTYYIEINCATLNATKTNLNVQFYYEGFENSDDQNVNFTYSVPIEIRVIPSNLLINNVSGGEEDNVYTFYNSYSSSIVGWQPFNFAVIPTGAEFDSLVIDLSGSELQLKYRNVVYTTGLVEIANINETVYIKGLDGATVTLEARQLPVVLNFSVIEADSMATSIKYNIIKGAEVLDFKSEDLKKNVYLDIEGGKQTFVDLFADAEFSNMTFTHLNGTDDVVRFEYNKENPFTISGYDYLLNFDIVPLACGTGSYTVMLDNGKMTTLHITVLEALNEISVSSNNEDNSISFMQEVVDGDDVSTLVYALNKDSKSYFDIQIIANSNENSKAIKSVTPFANSTNIELGNASENSQKFNVYLRQNGDSQLILQAEGYSVDNFRRINTSIEYNVNIISYSLIEKMNVYKTQDGFGSYADKTIASYTNVYSNTSNESVREAYLKVAVKNQNGFLFENPSNDKYLPETFDQKFVYWESDAPIYKNGVKVDKMSFTDGELNVYTIGTYGTFDTETMKFTAFSNLQNSGSLRLIAHIRQYRNLYSYTINVKISIYEEVERVTLQNMVDELEFSTLKREYTLIAEPTNSTATNGEIVALFTGGTINVDDKTYSILDKNSISYIESDGKTQIKLTLSEDFLQNSVNYQEEMKGTLLIVAKDWLDVAGNLNSKYQDFAQPVSVTFANGTEKNRFTITDADDLYAVKDNLSAHYKIKTTIDASSIVSKLPLGELRGSIVGENEYACITGLNISTSTSGDYQNDDGTNHFGLFKSISNPAYIEYIQFEGSLNIGTQTASHTAFSNIGLIAGVNYGKLINIGVTLNASSVYFAQGNIGGLVGINYGTIEQDFTLFEDENSKTYESARSESDATIAEQGRINYKNLTPKTMVFMKDFLNINYQVSNNANAYIRMGGVVGLNSGIIKKVDSQNLALTGYLNYMAYSLIKSAPSNREIDSISKAYVGGLVGENIVVQTGNVVTGGQIIGGYNNIDTSTGERKITFAVYDQYKQEIVSEGKTVEVGNFEAGNGIVVGGEVWGYGYVSGVVGRSALFTSSLDFAGITSRTFIRGEKIGNSVANISIIANIEKMHGQASLSNAFAVQAVDDGKTSEEASMVVLYNGEKIANYTNDINKLVFGNFSTNNFDVMRGYEGTTAEENKPINVFTYVISRDKELIPTEEDQYLYVENLPKSAYYGEFIVVGVLEGRKTIVDQMFFIQGAEENLSLSEKFNNRMISLSGNREIYYTYYYQVASADIDDLTSVQEMLDLYLNKINITNEFYPFVTNGEMIFTSRNTDILTIDQMGKITIKRTGLAQVSATSVLNSNDALSFYIYVVNYFNSEYEESDNNLKKSIIYPNLSDSAVAFDKTTIELRGENSATLYVRPDYSLEMDIRINNDNVAIFKSDSLGKASFRGVTFSLTANENVSAQVKETSGENNLDIEIVGQTITIRKLDTTQENYYSLTIIPRLELVLENDGEEEVYFNNVNKTISETQIDYKFGALYINNTNYNEVPIYTSKTIVDTIIVGSTDRDEGTPKYHILGLDNLPLQGTTAGQDYEYQENMGLFEVSFLREGSPVEIEQGRFEHQFTLKIRVNTNSPLYKNRYNQNIYGRYAFYLEAETNSGKNILIQIDLEKTNVFSVVVDNYTNLSEATTVNGLGTASPYAFPGESGLLAITVTPEDSDFDYILIENDDRNYQAGYSSALLGILARKDLTTGGTSTEMFADGTINGSITKKGLKITLDDIVNLYSNDAYVNYNGVIYIKYNMTSNNVVEGSVSLLNIKLVKDGQVVNNGSATKELVIKLKNYVAIEIDGKVGDNSNPTYYKTYNVARGLRYKLNINSYGFRLDNANIIVSNSALATIVKANDEYYLDITSSTINYPNNKFDITISVSQTDGEIVRTASSQTQIIVNEYVLNYNGEQIKNADIVTGMGDGIINVQVGSQTTLALDLYEYIEYDHTNSEVVNKIESFFTTMARQGNWTAYTNLISDDQPNYDVATMENQKTMRYRVGYLSDAKQTCKNYYFTSQGLDVIPIRTHMPEEKYYFFTYDGYFKSQNGVCTFDAYSDSQANRIETTFVLNVYSSSSEESPIPVYDYDDLNNMQKGGYYILLNDITISNEVGEDGISVFKPINANFASFDGNGHTINFGGKYEMGGAESLGLFSVVADGTIIKNLNVNFTSASDNSDINNDASDTTYGLYGLRTVKFVTTAESFIFGGIASENSGIITNCKVSTDFVAGNEYYLTVKADNALTGISYIGGIVGTNNGFITNSGVSINAKAPFNIGGVVGQNFNKISGCYFKEGKLINNSQFDQHVAGFTLTNSKDSQILSSYVAGAQTSTTLYSVDTKSYITSTLAGGGFIYENRGNIQDCYTDIDLSKTTSEMAGFVYRNSGVIKNAFSLSKLRNNVTASAGFVKDNSIDGTTGEFSNCYYFYNKSNIESENINTSLYNVTYEGVQALTEEQFNQIDKYFADYSYQETMGTNAVWFHSKGNTSPIFVDYLPTTDKIIIDGYDGNTQTNTVYQTKVMAFGKNRLELVNPNIKALSTRNFSYSEYDDATGNITYFYTDDANSPNRGSLHNPRLISNAENMESEILEQTSTTKINISNYRLISDIVYEGHSNLYHVVFAGSLEGNGMEISRLSLVSMESLDSAGLFAQIGYSASKVGTVKNLTITPAEVSFSNTINVGTLAGVLKYGEIYNITVNAVQGSAGTISGGNFVGGIIGRAVSSYKMKDIYSYANATANFSPTSDYSYNEKANNQSSCSYAGGLVGFAGAGTIYNAHVEEITSVRGSRVGSAYGGIGSGADVKFTYVNISTNSTIKSFHYAGFVAGEVCGTLSNVYVPNNRNIQSSFAVVPKTPVAVGGIVGRLNGGKLVECLIEQDFRVTNTDGSGNINIVGGLVGTVSADSTISYISNCKVSGDIYASNILGGGIGQISSALVVNGIAIQSKMLTVTGERSNPVLGGIVGFISENSGSSLEMMNGYSWSHLEVKTSTSGVQSVAQVGGLIGLVGNASKSPKLSYCYTTSRITAEVYDSRQTGSLQDFAELSGDNTSNELAGFSYKINGEVEERPNTYDSVYFLGSSVRGSENGGEDENKNVYLSAKAGSFVSFKTKTKNAGITLSVNNFGQSTSEYSTDLGQNELGKSEQSLYNLYGNEYSIESNNDLYGFTYLANTNSYYLKSSSNTNGGNEIKRGISFKEDANNAGNYYYEKTGFAVNNIPYANKTSDGVFDIIYLYTDKDGRQLSLEYRQDDQGFRGFKEVNTGISYQYASDGQNGEGFYRDKGTGNEDFLDLSKLTLRITFNGENLVQTKLLKDSKENYYNNSLKLSGGASKAVYDCYTNIKTGVEYYKIGDNQYNSSLTGNGEVLPEIPTIQVWNSTTTELSTLVFETKFNWLNKM